MNEYIELYMRNYRYKQETMQPFKQLAFNFNASAHTVQALAPTEAYATSHIEFSAVRIRPQVLKLLFLSVPFNNIANPQA